MATQFFGIRHHGPGSARSLVAALTDFQPDIILVEGPPDAANVLEFAIDKEMQPPVALLIYAADNPSKSVFYPFAKFSPEWQAIHFGLRANIPVEFMDLPQTHQMALEFDVEEEKEIDPIEQLAHAAGYDNSERWWNQLIEHRLDHQGSFDAIAEAMTQLREHATIDNRTALREAWMRKVIRKAQKDGFERIAVVCGAWHVPALVNPPKIKDDNALLKGLPKCKVQATWVPWTYSRLSYYSGYGAGIESPGWYEHLWDNQQYLSIAWLAKIAHLLREEDIDCSSANVIEAARLAHDLAALRNRAIPDLTELQDAAQTVLCFGATEPMQLIAKKLTISERLGTIPFNTPSVPLQQDLAQLQKSLRLKPEAVEKDIELDLRQENGLSKSKLLHRLTILNILWGQKQHTGGAKGTFKELWRVQWKPEFAIAIVEASRWGSTVEQASGACACHALTLAENLPEISSLLEQLIVADLDVAIDFALRCLEDKAAVASDIVQMMAALPALARLQRYSDVRQTKAEQISPVFSALTIRVCIGLPTASHNLDDDAATQLFEHLLAMNDALKLLQDEEYLQRWHQVLAQLFTAHALIAGRSCRILLDSGQMTADEVATQLSLSLSAANDSMQAGHWVDGFLRDSGIHLLHDEKIWQVLDSWVTELTDEAFVNVLPLLRRTFSSFSNPERRQMIEQVKHGQTALTSSSNGDFDYDAANASLPLLKTILGI